MIRIGTAHTLAPYEALTGRQLAMTRDIVDACNGMRATPYGRQGEDMGNMNALALCAELAFCSLANVYPDLNVAARAFRRYDCKLPCGTTVDVKHSQKDGAWLKVKKTDGEKADLFVLMTGDHRKMVFRGAATREELIRPERLYTDGVDHPFYAMHQRELSSISRKDG